MSDLIDRQAAIDRINKQREHLQPDIYPQDKIGDAAYRICAEFIERLPSAQRTGRWEYVKKRLVRGGYVDASECSVCHKRIMPHLKPNFCPNCGAKMKGEEE